MNAPNECTAWNSSCDLHNSAISSQRRDLLYEIFINRMYIWLIKDLAAQEPRKYSDGDSVRDISSQHQLISAVIDLWWREKHRRPASSLKQNGYVFEWEPTERTTFESGETWASRCRVDIIITRLTNVWKIDVICATEIVFFRGVSDGMPTFTHMEHISTFNLVHLIW